MANTVIQGWQKKKIYAIANALGFTNRNDKENDVLHMIVHSQTGKLSIRELTSYEANMIIAYLEKQKNHSIHDVMSQGQKKKCWQLMYELQSLDAVPNPAPVGMRLAGIIERQFNVKSTPHRVFNHLSKEDGNRLIEILKNYIHSAERKYMN